MDTTRTRADVGMSSQRARWPALVALVVVVLFAAGFVVQLVVGQLLPADARPSPVEDVGMLFAFGAFVLTGALLVTKRPRNAVSWMVLVAGLMPSVFQPMDTYGSWAAKEGRGVDVIGALGFWAGDWYWYLLLSLVMVFLPLYFPAGRLPSPRWRAWTLVPILSVVAITAAGMLQPTLDSQVFDDVSVTNPIGLAGMPDPEEELSFLFLGLLFGTVLAIAAVAVRFRRSRGAERQQLKVFLFAASGLLLLPVGDVAPAPIGDLMFPFVIAALPVAIALAVLRYRLYGIDRLISRTVSYALLTALLVGVYALGVLGIGALLPGERNDLLVAASTLAVAALFRPLRSRIQHAVDRRFNRARYDSTRTLEAFASRLRDEVDVDALIHDLRTTVGTTFGPRLVGIWTPGRHDD